MTWKNLVGLALLVCLAAVAASPPEPLRYVNPLSIEGTRSIADPAVLRFHGKYYLFLSGGLVWTSDDLVHWARQPVTLPGGRGVTAPHAFEYQGYVYLTGNDTGLYRSRDPLGPWEYIGDLKNEKGEKVLSFDSMIYADDDGRVYLYYSGRSVDGIYGVELDRKDLTRYAAAPKKLWSYNKAHVWERYGDYNEGTELSWIEAPWMTKRNGTYYLQYSAPGTEWKTYALGVYTGKSPLGPFTYAPRNPMLVHNGGLINGTGHHCIVEGPGGGLWAIYTVLYRNWGVFDRRIGMDPVSFDEKGNMFIKGPSEAPQWGPGARPKGAVDNASGSIPLSVNKYTWAVSSSAPGRDALYAFDNNVRTWWEPAETDSQPWLMLDLGSRNPTDPNQEFMADSLRLLLDAVPHTGPADLVIDGHGRWYGDSAKGLAPVSYQYKLEVSLDNKSYKTVVDKTANRVVNNVEFDEFAPVRCRYVKLTFPGAKKPFPTGVLEFTVFGKSAESAAR